MNAAVVEERARDLAALESSFLEGFRAELVTEIPRIEAFARMRLDQAEERFPNERRTAEQYLTKDALRRILWLSTAIAFLQHAPVEARFDFINGSFEKQDKIVRQLIRDCGFDDRNGRWIWLQ